MISEQARALALIGDRLHGVLDASVMRQLRLGAQEGSLRDALIAGLFAPPPRTESAKPGGTGSGPAGLTPRQYQIALLVAEGLTNRQIARQLGIPEWTATNHLRVVMQKLECTSRVYVVRAMQAAR
ncbi:helix-turn-helix transcriptional regulator [Streptomyces sp. NPDC005151]